jgi:diacylglycerol O-acyltransferase
MGAGIMTFDRLTAVDASFLYLESDHEPQHVGSLAFVEGQPLRDPSGRLQIDELRTLIERRLDRVPRLRQRLMEVPLGAGRPIWVDDECFEIDYHVRVTAVPAPGDAGQVHDLMGRVQSIPLDRSKPLWEIWFVDGLAGDEVGFIIKTHHSMGDGIANVDLAMALVDTTPDPAPELEERRWAPSPAPTPIQLLLGTMVEQVRRPVELTAGLVGALRSPARLARDVGDTISAVRKFGSSRPSPAPWNIAVGRNRRWASATVPLSTVRQIRDSRPGSPTINDAVLAMCTVALSEYMVEIGGSATEPLKAMVPVSLRADDQHGDTLGNQVSLMIVDLPVEEPDGDRIVSKICSTTQELKGSGMAAGAGHIVAAAGEIPALSGAMARMISRQIPMNLVITNVPGPPMRLYVHGSRVLRAHPYVEVIDGEGLTIAVLSYDDHLFFGLTSDLDVMPDLDLLAEAIEKGAAVLAG